VSSLPPDFVVDRDGDDAPGADEGHGCARDDEGGVSEREAVAEEGSCGGGPD